MNPSIYPRNKSPKEVYQYHFDDDSLFYFSPTVTFGLFLFQELHLLIFPVTICGGRFSSLSPSS